MNRPSPSGFETEQDYHEALDRWFAEQLAAARSEGAASRDGTAPAEIELTIERMRSVGTSDDVVQQAEELRRQQAVVHAPVLPDRDAEVPISVRVALEAMRDAYGNGVLHQQAVTALAALDAKMAFGTELPRDLRLLNCEAEVRALRDLQQAFGDALRTVATQQDEQTTILTDALTTVLPVKTAPVQKDKYHPLDGTIPWSTHEKAWQGYAAAGHGSQSAERIAERGGFSYREAQCAIAGHYNSVHYCVELHPILPGWQVR